MGFFGFGKKSQPAPAAPPPEAPAAPSSDTFKATASIGDDLYSGYNQPSLGGMRIGMVTAAPPPMEGAARPMTAVKAAGYSSAPAVGKFDPFAGAMPPSGPAAPLQKRSEASAEDRCKELERQVNQLMEEACLLLEKGDPGQALERAKDAGKKERTLCKEREQAGLAEQINLDLTYAVCFNLAHMYQQNKLYTEALNTYSSVVKNKQFPQAGRLRVNMGNLYFEQRKYPNAIKMYRMALDQIPNTARELRFKVMKNIGHAFVRLGQYQDAMQSYDTVMEGAPDVVTGYNLVVCFHALGDKEKMKKSFTRLLSTTPPDAADENDADFSADDSGDDGLRSEMRRRKVESTRFLLMAAKLIAPVIDRASGKLQGYDWVAEQCHSLGYSALAHEMEMAKAIQFLSGKEFEHAIEVLKAFERKEQHLKARAATNLSFLYFLEGELKEADKYAEMGVSNDRYNARALVNRANCLVERGDVQGAKALCLEAVSVEADCVEAIYNLGLVNKRLGQWEDALVAFKKLHSFLPESLEVLFQIGSVYDLLGDSKQSVKWFELLHSRVPYDPGVLARLGAVHSKMEDEAKALHYYSESHRVYPVNMDVICWLGAFHVKSELYEKAMPYFDLASKIQPQEVKWLLMVASCHRRIGAYPAALAKYLEIHKARPENVECLRYLLHIYTEMGHKEEVQDYAVKLRKAERAAQEATSRAPQGTLVEVPTQGYYTPPSDPTIRPGLAAPAPLEHFKAPDRAAGRTVQAGFKREEDEWGSGMLGDDLLPGM